MRRALLLYLVLLLFAATPAFAQQGADAPPVPPDGSGEVAPEAGEAPDDDGREDEPAPGDDEPFADEGEEDGASDAGAWEDEAWEEGGGEELVPEWDDGGEELTPEWDDGGTDWEEGGGEELTPEWDDGGGDWEVGGGEELTPEWDDGGGDWEDGGGEELTPEWDDGGGDWEEGGGEADTLTPDWDDGGDWEEGAGEELAPSWEEEPSETEELGDDEEDAEPAPWQDFDWEEELEEEEEYDEFWEEFDEQEAEESVEISDAIPEGLGRIVGVVYDAEFDQPMPDVRVSIDDTQLATRSGVDGRFALDVAEGTWVVRFFSHTYEEIAFEVEVFAGEPTDMGTIELAVDEQLVETIHVEGRAIQESVATQMLRRREATTVSDAISAEEMSRSPDSSARDAVRRVVAATIKDGKFLFVRGLGGRYTNVQLNGSPVPNTDPDFPGVQLDLFPARLLSSMTLFKTFAPNLPGDWVGGLMQLESREFPEDRQLGVGASVSYSPGTSFETVRGYQGGAFDWLGFDDGTRALPSEVPDDRSMSIGGGYRRSEVAEIARSFDNNWALTEETALPNLSFNATSGDSYQTAGEGEFGYLATLTYSNKWSADEETIRSVTQQGSGEDRELRVEEELDRSSFGNDILWGALGTFGYRFNPNHQLTLTQLFNQSASNETDLTRGVFDESGEFGERTRYRWTQRSLSFTQLRGRHLHMAGDTELHWRFSAGIGRRVEPDTRNLLYTEGATGTLRWDDFLGSGERFYSNLDQQDYGAGLDFGAPFGERVRFRTGTDLRLGTREFRARRFKYEFTGTDPAVLEQSPDELFEPQNLGDTIRLSEATRPDDGYDATQRLAAGYGMLEITPVDSLRLIGGARWEGFDQSVELNSPTAIGNVVSGAADDASRFDNDVLGAASVIWEMRESMFLRAAYGGTVARPLLRELAPFVYFDYVRRRIVQGNLDLDRTYVHNLDLRWEFFPTNEEVIAASVFTKLFQQPIEQVILDANGTVQPQNIDGATNIGAEVEAKASLGHLHESLGDFSLAANFAYIFSEVRLTDEQSENVTNQERPLAGQSPYVVNASLGYQPAARDYSLFLFYNVAGRRIEEVGMFGLPDVYQEPEHSLDLTAMWDITEQWKLKGTWKNIAFQAPEQTQGGIVVSEVEPTTSFSLSLSWKL